jgi:hypothetical protein
MVEPRTAAAREFNLLLLKFGGDFYDITIDKYLSNIATDPLQWDAMRLNLDRLRLRLEGTDPSPAEKVLAERAVICYLDAYYADLCAITDAHLHLARFLDERKDRAQRRLEKAVLSLAVCRRIEASTIRDEFARFKVVG